MLTKLFRPMKQEGRTVLSQGLTRRVFPRFAPALRVPPVAPEIGHPLLSSRSLRNRLVGKSVACKTVAVTLQPRKTMKNFKIAIGAALLALATPVFAQLTLAPGGFLRIEGDSTLHQWSSTATAVSMTFTLADGAPADLAEAIKASKVKGMTVSIPTAGLRSGESGLDKNMRKAMFADKNPEVTYRLEKYELAKADAGKVAAKTTGTLTIAGTPRTVTIDVEFTLGAGAPEVKGSYALKMSDYGIKPPSLMFGAIKVRDPVTIRFDLVLKPQDAAKKGGS
jgi:polyisoprenoid-binding protein YceI